MSVEAPEVVPLPLEPERKEGQSRAMKASFSSPLASAIVVLITIAWTIPTLGLFITSIRPANDVAVSGWWTWFTHPSFTLQNYTDVLNGGGAGTSSGLLPFFINSFIITIPGALFPLALAAMAAYALAWIPFRGTTFLFFAVFALQVVPLQMSLIPLLQLFTGKAEFFGVSIPTPRLVGSQVAFPFLPLWIAHTMFA